MNRQNTLLLFLSLFSIACQKQIDAFSITEADIKQVIIVNKTNTKKINSQVHLSAEATRELLKEISNSYLVHEPNIRSNNGYLEIQFLLKNGHKFEIDIIETHYTGIIVNGLKDYQYYRNDKLFRLLNKHIINLN